MIRDWNDINVDMCKSINMIGFGERRYDLYEKINRALKDTTAIAHCFNPYYFKINFLNESIWEKFD